MAKNRPTGSDGATAPISGHRLFPAVIAIWGAAIFGLGSAVLPTALIERMIAASGIAALIPAAAEPLSFDARILMSLLAALAGGWLGIAVARRITVAQYNALPTSSNRMARITGQRPISAGGGIETADFALLPPGDAFRHGDMRFDVSTAPYSVWGDAPPAARPAVYGPELPELLLSEELEADKQPGGDLGWQVIGSRTHSEAESEESYFDAYVDWPSEPAQAPETEFGEHCETAPDAASPDDEEPEADLFTDPATHGIDEFADPVPEAELAAWSAEEPAAPEETYLASGDVDQPEFEEDASFEIERSEAALPEAREDDLAGGADDAVEAGAPADVGPDEGFGAESWAGDSEAYVWPDAESLAQPFDAATEPLSSDAEAAKSTPVLPPEGKEIGSDAQEAAWPSTPPAISAGLDSFGEPEDEDDSWPQSGTADEADEVGEDWDEAGEFELDEEEDAPILDTTLGAFRDYAREYTGGDDGEEEEEEEEEDDSTSSFGSLLGMTVRRRAADEPIELVGFDGETVPITDAEIKFPDELEIDPELDSPLVVRRRMGGA